MPPWNRVSYATVILRDIISLCYLDRLLGQSILFCNRFSGELCLSLTMSGRLLSGLFPLTQSLVTLNMTGRLLSGLFSIDTVPCPAYHDSSSSVRFIFHWHSPLSHLPWQVVFCPVHFLLTHYSPLSHLQWQLIFCPVHFPLTQSLVPLTMTGRLLSGPFAIDTVPCPTYHDRSSSVRSIFHWHIPLPHYLRVHSHLRRWSLPQTHHLRKSG